MARNKGKKLGCFAKLLITLAVIIVILAILFVVFINLTPRQMGLADIDLGGKTLSDLGIADMKIIDLYKSIKNLANANEADIVNNPFNADQEKANAKASFEDSSLKDVDDYSSIVSTPVVYDTQKLITYKDQTLAGIFDNIVKNYSGSDEAIKYLKDAKVSIKEMTITNAGGKGNVRLVCAIDVGVYKEDVEEAMGGASGIFKVPDVIFLVSEIEFEVPSTGVDAGVLKTQSKSICVNGDNDNPVTKAILSVFLSDGDETIDSLNGKLGEALSTIIKNLGLVGTADVNTSSEVTGNISLGMGGVVDHNISVITYVKSI